MSEARRRADTQRRAEMAGGGLCPFHGAYKGFSCDGCEDTRRRVEGARMGSPQPPERVDDNLVLQIARQLHAEALRAYYVWENMQESYRTGLLHTVRRTIELYLDESGGGR